MKELLNHEMELKFFFSQFFKLTERASKCDILFWFVLFPYKTMKLKSKIVTSRPGLPYLSTLGDKGFL